jgi:hypothetical protein
MSDVNPDALDFSYENPPSMQEAPCDMEDAMQETPFDMEDEIVFDYIAQQSCHLRYERYRMRNVVIVMNSLGMTEDMEKVFKESIDNIRKIKEALVDQFPSDYTCALREIGYFTGTGVRGDQIVDYTGFWVDPPNDDPRAKLLHLRKTLTWIVARVDENGLGDEIEKFLFKTWDGILKIKNELGVTPGALEACGYFKKIRL